MATKPTKKRVRLYGVQSQSRDGGKYQRPKSDERYHTWRWTKESRAFREDHPLCVLCLEKGLFVPQINSSSPLTPHGGTDAASSGGGGDILNYYDLTPPADGIDRNFEALARRCKGLGVPESDFKAICRLTNFGRIGDKVWMILRDVEQRKGEIKATGRYLTSLLLKEG